MEQWEAAGASNANHRAADSVVVARAVIVGRLQKGGASSAPAAFLRAHRLQAAGTITPLLPRVGNDETDGASL